MKKKPYLLVSLLMALALCTGCSEDDSMTEIVPPKKEEQPSNDEVFNALKAIPGVYNVEVGKESVYAENPETKEMEKTEDKAYNIDFVQYIDNHDPSCGVYTQRVRLIFKGFDKDVVLYTHGYSFREEKMRYTPLATQLDANQIDVEHRYFGGSLPENFEDSRLTYLNADQQAHDLHNIVSTLRSTLFSQGKWVSTGVSKDGITTALQAYYSDKYDWRDIDVFVPFCAPFLKGTTYSDGSFSCMDITTGTYLYQVSGSGYEAGSVEQRGYENLKKIPYYICTHEKIRQAAIEAAYTVDPASYNAILNQYHQNSPNSTGIQEKDLAAFAIYAYFDRLFDKFSYSHYYRWASLVPDMDYLASGNAGEKDYLHFKNFFSWGSEDVDKEVEKLESATRGTVTDTYWRFLLMRRGDSTAPYYVQGFKELGIAEVDFYSCVDGTFLTAEQCYSVNNLLTTQSQFEGTYPQDRGKLMTDFLTWVETETTMPLVFVYAYNDPWTGAGVTSSWVKPNPMVVSIVDGIAVHNDYIHNRKSYTQKSQDAIVEALNKFMK